MSSDQTEKKAPIEAKVVAIAEPKTSPPAQFKVKKVVLMGHNHTDEKLIEVFKKIFANLPKTDVSVAVELPAMDDLSSHFEKYKTYFPTIRQVFETSAFLKNCSLTELANVQDIEDYLSQQTLTEGESGLTVAQQKSMLVKLFLLIKTTPVMLCLCEQIIAGGYTHFCFDDTQEARAAVHAHNSLALGYAREPIMAKNLAAASTPYVFAIIGASHLAGVKKLLNMYGIETEEVGIKVKEVVDARSNKIVDLVESGSYDSVFESSLFTKAIEAIPAYASVATAATSVTGQSTWWTTLNLKHIKKQNAKNAAGKNKIKSEILQQIIPQLVFDANAIQSAGLTSKKALDILEIYEKEMAPPTAAFLALKDKLRVSSPQLAAGSAAKVGAGIASIAAAVAATNVDAPTPAAAAIPGHKA
jgi:hypothetical protein